MSQTKANNKINKTDPVSQANNSCCQQFPSLWSTNHGLQTAHMMEARNTTACTSRSLLLISVCSQMLQVNMEDSGRTLATPSNPTINDEKCARGYCSICEVAAPVRRVTVRGLCQLSIFDRSSDTVKLLFICACTDHPSMFSRVYNYIINDDGQPMFVGSHTSVLLYNRSISSWVWYAQY